MNMPLTVASEREYQKIRSGEMTPAMAAGYLQDEQIPLRTFSATLKEIYPNPDAYNKLVNAFQTDGTPLASVQRKIANWLNGAAQPSDREDIFRVAFALGLSLAETSRLLGICTEYSIHYREGRDAIYAWCLSHDIAYQEAHDLLETLPKAPPLEEPKAGENQYSLTRKVQEQFTLARTKEDLIQAYMDNLNNLGTYHLRAYHYFSHYMEALLHPASDWDDTPEEAYSLDTVMKLYLTLGMPSGKARTGYNLTQKLIKRGWPNTTALKNILAHRADVPRKLLLLLYVVTENAADADEYSELDEDYLTPEERLDEHWWVVNAMLMDCGMPPLDPRMPSDWLMCYALAAGNDESMGERLEQVLDKLYENMR